MKANKEEGGKLQYTEKFKFQPATVNREHSFATVNQNMTLLFVLTLLIFNTISGSSNLDICVLSLFNLHINLTSQSAF
jgi:hypothetical protein